MFGLALTASSLSARGSLAAERAYIEKFKLIRRGSIVREARAYLAAGPTIFVKTRLAWPLHLIRRGFELIRGTPALHSTAGVVKCSMGA